MKRRLLATLLLAFPAAAQAEPVTVQVNGQSVQIQAPDVPSLPSMKGVGVTGTSTSSGQGNSVSTTIGGIGQDAQVQGVTVINGQVWIDGEKIPNGVHRYTSKSGQKYVIERHGSGVSVRSE